MSATQNVVVGKLDNGWLATYWTKRDRELVERKVYAANLGELADLIAVAYGVAEQPIPPHPLSPHAARAIARAENEDDAVGDPIGNYGGSGGDE